MCINVLYSYSLFYYLLKIAISISGFLSVKYCEERQEDIKQDKFINLSMKLDSLDSSFIILFKYFDIYL